MCPRALILTLLLALSLVTEANAVPQKLTVTSTAFRNGGIIPKKFTCFGRGISPQIGWSQVPPGTASIVVILEDLAPDEAGDSGPSKWGIYNIAKNQRSIAENFRSSKVGSTINSDGKSGYSRPCNSSSSTYSFKVYALNIVLPKSAYKYTGDLDYELQFNSYSGRVGALFPHILAKGTLNAKYRPFDS